MDAERDHAKLELEQFKVDIARAMKQKVSLEKALGKKVIVFVFFLNFSWRILVIPAAIFCAL